MNNCIPFNKYHLTYNPIAVGIRSAIRHPCSFLLKECFGGLYAPLETGNNNSPFEMDRTQKKLGFQETFLLALYILKMALSKQHWAKHFQNYLLHYWKLSNLPILIVSFCLIYMYLCREQKCFATPPHVTCVFAWLIQCLRLPHRLILTITTVKWQQLYLVYGLQPCTLRNIHICHCYCQYVGEFAAYVIAN